MIQAVWYISVIIKSAVTCNTRTLILLLQQSCAELYDVTHVDTGIIKLIVAAIFGQHTLSNSSCTKCESIIFGLGNDLTLPSYHITANPETCLLP